MLFKRKLKKKHLFEIMFLTMKKSLLSLKNRIKVIYIFLFELVVHVYIYIYILYIIQIYI